MALNQVGQNVTNQLSKQLDIDATGLLTPNMLIPAPMVTPPLQTNFGSYQLGYSPFIPPPTMAQVIPAAPPAGASSPHHYQALSDQNLHPLLFQIEPHPDLFAHVHVPLVIDQHTQQPVFGRDPNRQLRFFSFLPHWINVNVRGELLELWFRLDSRLQLSDITDRINVPATQKIPNAGAFNMRRNRFRALINVPVYSQSRNRPLKADVELLGQMSREQVLLNTSMLVDVNNGMLLKPVVRTGQVASFVDSGLLSTISSRHSCHNLSAFRLIGNLWPSFSVGACNSWRPTTALETWPPTFCSWQTPTCHRGGLDRRRHPVLSTR